MHQNQLVIFALTLLQIWCSDLFSYIKCDVGHPVEETSIYDLEVFSVVVSRVPSVTKFLDLMEGVPMKSKLDDSRQVTVFLPHNKAFDDYVFPNNGTRLPQSIGYSLFASYVVPDIIQLVDGMDITVQTLEGSPMRIVKPLGATTPVVSIGSSPCLQSARIENPDAPIITSNGAVYIISNIIAPTSVLDYIKLFRVSQCV